MGSYQAAKDANMEISTVGPDGEEFRHDFSSGKPFSVKDGPLDAIFSALADDENHRLRRTPKQTTTKEG